MSVDDLRDPRGPAAPAELGDVVVRIPIAVAARPYEVLLGPNVLDNVGPVTAATTGAGRVALVTDDEVEARYAQRVTASLSRAGVSSFVVRVPPGEASKDWAVAGRVLESLAEHGLDRTGAIVALGGGVVGDLAGFCAAVYLRGVPFVQVPTTLLAQVDSSVGGKTAINHARGKNMVGAFHQPLAVIADVATLDSLPVRELRAGLAEVIKHGCILDLQFVAWLEANMDRLLARDRAALGHAVRRSCELKAQVVAADEREGGLRAILNFGHTFGHAIETGAGYGEWLHGEAVAAGMVMAVELSVRTGTLRREDADRIRALIVRAGLPVRGPALPIERYLELMQVDKKASGGRVHYVLLEGLGRAALRGDLDPALIRESIAAAAQ